MESATPYIRGPWLEHVYTMGGTLHGVRGRCLHEGLGTEPQPPGLFVPGLLRPLLLRLRPSTLCDLMRPSTLCDLMDLQNGHQLTVLTFCIYVPFPP